MAKKTRTPDQIERDRALIAERRLKGYKQSDIALELGVTQQQVSYDLKVVRKRWRDDQIASVEEHVSQKIAEVELVKQKAWEAWDASTQTKEIEIQEVHTVGDRVTKKRIIRRERSTGNAAYLGQILNCIEKESALRNLPTELKYQDINTAIRTVTSAGFEVREGDERLDLSTTESSDDEQ